MPNLYKRGRTWWCWGYDAKGKRWYESTRQRDKGAATRVARRIELERAIPPDAPPLPLGEALALLEEHKRRLGRSDATLEIFNTKQGHLTRIWGERRDLTKLTLADTEAYLDQRRREEVSDHTIAKELGVLRSALRVAAKHGRYPGDPKALWPDALEDVYSPRTRWLPLEEYRALLEQLTAYRQDYIVIYCHLGVRYSELYRIEGRHLDHAERQVFVDGTKTKASKRWVPCDDDAWEVLTRRSEQHPSGPLFPGRWYRSRMGQDLRAACKRASIEPVTTNDFRRTFASWLCNAGVPELVTVRLMGHNSSQMVRRVYAQLAPKTLRDAIDRLPSSRLRVVTRGVTDGESKPRTSRTSRTG